MKYKFIISPLSIFYVSWIAVVILYQLRITPLLIDMNLTLICHILLLAALSGVFYFIGVSSAARSKNIPRQVTKSSRKTELKLLFSLMVILLIMEIIYSDGLPFFWLLSGSGKTYTEFGIPSIHGFFNSVLLFMGTLSVTQILSDKDKRFNLAILIFCLAVPILTIHRQSLISLFLQLFFVILLTQFKLKGLNFRLIFKYFFMAIVVFGLIGNIRSGDEHLAALAGLNGVPSYFGPLIWVYMYVTTPLSNFIELTQLEFQHSYGAAILTSLIPTAIRPDLIGDQTKDILEYFYGRAFNSSSYAFIPYIDFGWIGVYSFTLLIMFFSGRAYKKWCLEQSIYSAIKLAIYNQLIFLFIFSNFFLSISMLFQFMLLNFFKRATHEY